MEDIQEVIAIIKNSKNKRLRPILELRCQNKVAKEIYPKLGFKSEAAYRVEMGHIWSAFGMTDDDDTTKNDFLNRVICPALAALKREEEQGSGPNAQSQNQNVLATREMVHNQQNTQNAESPVPEPEAPRVEEVGRAESTGGSLPRPVPLPPAPRRLPLVILFLIGLFCLAAAVVVGEWIFFTNQLAQLQTPTVETRIPTQLARTNPTAMPTDVPTNTPAPTATLIPTTTQPPPTPTPTTEPTLTPTRVVPMALPFNDNFDKGRRPEWIVLGSPVIEDKKIRGGSGDVFLELPLNRTQYTIDFDFNTDWYNVVSLTFANQLIFSWTTDYRRWNAFQNGAWNELSATRGSGNRTGHFQLVVDRSTYTVSFDRVPLPSLTYGQPIAGPLKVGLSAASAISKFSITGP